MLSSILLLKFLFFSSEIENKNYERKISYISKIFKNESISDSSQKKELDKIKKIILSKYFLKNIDFLSDSGINKFVNNKIHFNKIDYEPINLENIEGEFLIDSKGNSKIRKEALIELQNISKDFYNRFSQKITIVSAYRSYIYQVRIKNGGCPDNFCAKAGYSEHQTGLAIDVFEASNIEAWQNSKKLQKYYKWLDENSHKYGFTNTYKKGIEVDGYEIEPWHWRYVGEELANYLKENNITFAELYYKK